MYQLSSLDHEEQSQTVSNGGSICYHCGRQRMARCCPHCGYHDIADGEMTVCQRCGGVFKLGRCFQCDWSGEPFSKAERNKFGENRYVLGMFELEKMAQRLARKASLLKIVSTAEGPVGDAMNYAFAAAHSAPGPSPDWTSRFEASAGGYLEQLAQDEIDAIAAAAADNNACC